MSPSLIFFLAIAARVVQAADELPAAHGPPPDSDPLTWGFYASPEQQTPAELEIEGSFPTWLEGSLYRGAFATWDTGNFTAEHWFDGFSRHHVFNIANGAVSYHSRNASDELMEFVREEGFYPEGMFGGDPCKIIFGAFETTFRDSKNPVGDRNSSTVPVSWIPNFPGLDRNTTSVGGDFGTLVATTDANVLQQIDPVTLESIEIFTYGASHPLLEEGGRTAAHVAHNPDGSITNYMLDPSTTPPTYRIFTISPQKGEVKILATITDAPPAYIHSVFNTENYIVFIVWQADIVRPGKTLLSTIGPWDPARKSLFYVIDRVNGGVVSKYVSEEAFFAFHQVNSFEDESGDIYVDMAKHNDTSFIYAAEVPNLRANLGKNTNGSAKHDLPGIFTRFKLPRKHNSGCSSNGTVVTQIAEVEFTLPHLGANIELPRINQEMSGKPYRYAYGVHTNTTGYFLDSLIKVDTKTQTWKTWIPSVKQLPSEPIFVAAPGAVREDDGVLLTVAMDSAVKKSSLVVINATTMNEMGRARMPIVMAYGFHGVWGSGK